MTTPNDGAEPSLASAGSVPALTEEERRGLELMRDLALAQGQGEERYLMVRAACSILARSGRSSPLDE
jgi:hypothetical protein